jgi:hypothetical protein
MYFRGKGNLFGVGSKIEAQNNIISPSLAITISGAAPKIEFVIL